MTIWRQEATSQALAIHAQLTPMQAEAALKGLAKLINRKVKAGDTIIIEGLGTFEPMVLGGITIQFRDDKHKEIKC